MKLRILFVGVVVCLFATTVLAQDPVKVDPKHYKVESENAQARILRVHYGAHEKSVMHSHPNAVIVYLTDGTTKMTTPDGKWEERPGKAGEAVFTPAGTHLPENVRDRDFEGILVELKGSKGAPKK